MLWQISAVKSGENRGTMKKIGFFINPDKDPQGEIENSITVRFRAAGIGTVRILDFTENAKGLDALVVVGGDGTILRAASFAVKNALPVLGINRGELGFLTEFEANERSIDDLANCLISGNLIADDRTMLKMTAGNKTALALNDVVIQRKSGEKTDRQVVKISAFAGGNLLDSFVSDGVIVSTPTGSTAYFLSAGGNVLSPGIKAIALTPVCAHSLRSRPIILPDDEKIELLIGDGADAEVVSDGVTVGQLKPGDWVYVKKYRRSLRFYRKKGWNFYDVLRQKFSSWSR